MVNFNGVTPFCSVFENKKTMAPNILRAFLEADPELILVWSKQRDDELPIHCCIQMYKNPHILEFLSIRLERDHDLVHITSLLLKGCFLSIWLPTVVKLKSCKYYINAHQKALMSLSRGAGGLWLNWLPAARCWAISNLFTLLIQNWYWRRTIMAWPLYTIHSQGWVVTVISSRR